MTYQSLHPFTLDNKPYQLYHILKLIEDRLRNAELVTGRKGCKYFNVPCAFDIETTSFYDDSGEKQGLMYAWAFGVNGAVIVGRTWEEFQRITTILSNQLDLGLKKRLIVYVHNLSFDFQFFRSYQNIIQCFATARYKPIYAVADNGIEYRDSYILTGYNLEHVGKNLSKYKVNKLVGDLDYRLLRSPETPLTETERGYIVNDVLVVMADIQERIEREGGIHKIPLTKTGYVRRYCRDACYHLSEHTEDGKPVKAYWKYKDIISGMRLNPDEYELLLSAFQGGFTHASAWKVGKTLADVGSYDIASSYPAVMCMKKFPMSAGKLVKVRDADHFQNLISKYCCVFEAEFTNLQDSVMIDHPLSASRCTVLEGYTVDNGRVVSAKRVVTVITELDYLVYTKFYTWDELKIGKLIRYYKGYLPRDLVKCVLELYRDKTTLKGVPGYEVEYLGKKELVNSIYGCTVTRVVRDDIVYSGNAWGNAIPADADKQIAKYNNNPGRFLFFAWGVYVTAWARYRLFNAIYNVGHDYVYSDTDSVKLLHPERHKAMFDLVNDETLKELETALTAQKLPLELARPIAPDGKVKPLGVFEFEGTYDKFKTLGAKRYLTQSGDKYTLTVAGLGKKNGMEWMQKTFKTSDAIFAAFSNRLEVPPEGTGKLTHTYIDEPSEGCLTDWAGKTHHYVAKTAVHLEPCSFSFNMAKQFLDYLRGIEEMEGSARG